MNPALLPYAVTVSALYLGLGLLPFKAAGIGWDEALVAIPGQGLAGGHAIQAVLLALPLGFFWQATFWSWQRAMRATLAVAVFAGLAVLATLRLWGQLYFTPELLAPHGMLFPLLGFAAGGVFCWLLAPALQGRHAPARLWSLLVALAALSVLLPLDLGTSLRSPSWPAGFVAYVADIPQRFYLMLKSAILWVPVGFLVGLSGHAGALPRWGMALALAWLLQGLPVLWQQPITEVLELLFALPGLWLGAWLAEKTRLSGVPAQVLASVASEPLPAVAAGRLGGNLTQVSEHTAAPPKAEGERTQGSRRSKAQATPRGGRRLHPMRVLGSLPLLALLAVGVVAFPLWQWGLGLGLALYMGALWLWPLSWLVVLPAALPLLDLAPWSGRFFFDEFDLLLLATTATLLLRGRHWPRAGRPPAWPLLMLSALSLLISLLLGLGSPPAVDANAFSSYWSPYNSLRVAKGFAWGGMLFLLLRLSRPEPAPLAGRLALGMGIGLLGVGLVGVWERWLFAGFANDEHTYRIVSTFSSMHTGGGHIEAYLAAALPFLWLGMARWRSMLFAVPVMALTVYVVIFTVARGGALALGVILLVLAAASLHHAWQSGQRRQAVVPLGILALLAILLLAGIGGGYFQQRLAKSAEDWQIRMDHWRDAIAMMDATPMAQLFGMGLGSFPRVYLERGPADKQPATFGFLDEDGAKFLRLSHGDTLYYAQRVNVQAGERYHLEVDARSLQEGARLDVPVCEKQLLNSRNCVWISLNVPADGQWQRLSHDFYSGAVGLEAGLSRPPVELFLHYPGKAGTIDVDNIRLVDASGANLIGNGGFTWAGDYWFFKTHSHLPWHIKNVWVHVLFEQGWLGLLLFSAVVILALARLGRAAWTGKPLAWVWLAALLGLLSVGLFDSLFDAPRLGTLLTLLLLLGLGYDWETKALSRQKGKKRVRHAPHPDARDLPAEVTARQAIHFETSNTSSAR